MHTHGATVSFFGLLDQVNKWTVFVKWKLESVEEKIVDSTLIPTLFITARHSVLDPSPHHSEVLYSQISRTIKVPQKGNLDGREWCLQFSLQQLCKRFQRSSPVRSHSIGAHPQTKAELCADLGYNSTH